MAAALLASCGGGESISVEDDQKAVERAIAAFEATLREDGFETAEDDGDDDDDDFEFASEECKEFETLFGDQDELPGSTADVDSADMEKGELDGEGGAVETAQASVALVREEKDIDTFFALLRDERLQPCLQEAAELSFEQQASEEGGGLTVADLSIAVPMSSGVGDDSVAIALTGTFEVPDTTIPFGFRFEFAREGRAAAFLSLGAIGAPTSKVDAGPLLRELLDEAR